ncbi:MAG: nucleotidyltransferase domain-containing protein [Methanomicrobiales archaeon]|nr:nucleotidyltransferase domain-containing protein [Methanomicrobiales archaeon]
MQDLAALIRTSRNVSRIILHGSYARGDVHEGSDIDLIIIGDFPERFHIRTTAILEMTALPIEPLCYTKEEFDAMIANGNSFLQNALEEGYEI